MQTTFETIVLSGGGARGLAYLGIMKFLEDNQLYPTVRNVIGTSVGAIFAVLMAKRYTCEEVHLLLKDHPLSNIDDGYCIPNIFSIFWRFGYYKGKALQDFIDAFCGEETFQSLYAKTRIHLTITGSNISKHKVEFFNTDTEPDMPIATAVRISTSYPFVFPAVTYNDSYYVDGGLTCNIPADYYHGNGLVFILDDEAGESIHRNTSIAQYTKNIYKTLLEARNTELTYKKVINIRHTGVDTFDFDIGAARIKDLVDIGYQAVADAIPSMAE